MKARKITRAFLKSRCDCEADGGCWLWKEGCGPDGAARMCMNGKSALVARVMWKIIKKTHPKGVLFSTCGIKRCVNPAHRIDAEKRDLPRLQSEYGRIAKGAPLSAIRLQQMQRSAKVNSLDKARRIRELAAEMRYEDVGEIMGISESLVGQIVRGEKWREGILA